jgi:hypothetical protein
MSYLKLVAPWRQEWFYMSLFRKSFIIYLPLKNYCARKFQIYTEASGHLHFQVYEIQVRMTQVSDVALGPFI